MNVEFSIKPCLLYSSTRTGIVELIVDGIKFEYNITVVRREDSSDYYISKHRKHQLKNEVNSITKEEYNNHYTILNNMAKEIWLSFNKIGE